MIGMKLLAPTMVIARRDFLSIVATPTFLLFLLAPLIMVVFGAIGGLSATQLAENAGSKERIIAIVPAADIPAFIAADARLRAISGGMAGPPALVVNNAATTTPASITAWRQDADVLALLEGDAANPRIAHRSEGGFPGRYIASVAELVAREGRSGAVAADASRPIYMLLATTGTGRAAQSALGYSAVFAIFLLTLLLAGQAVGMLAEEKSNKVIEILAAAVPLESVFFGKLLGMLGVALLFLVFWGVLLGGAAGLAIANVPDQAAAAMALQPAIGWPMFLALGLLYLLSAFLLLGGVFLGVGAQASTVREIQMLSLPITLFQIAMFSLSSAAANAPDSTLATIAQAVPWSSPFAMAARGATDAALWPHVAALGWQILWIGLTIRVSVALFRRGVLRSGGGFSWPWKRRTN
ncbi:MAG: ABC transporter permease [Sphingopyxis sp.]